MAMLILLWISIVNLKNGNINKHYFGQFVLVFEKKLKIAIYFLKKIKYNKFEFK